MTGKILYRAGSGTRRGRFNPNQPREPAGTERGGEFRSTGVPKKSAARIQKKKTRSQLAKLSHKPHSKDNHAKAMKGEALVFKIVGGEHLPDNEPMDILVSVRGRTIGVEVKTVIHNKNDKITMHPESKERKEKWLKKNKAIGFTVIVDMRGKAPRVLARQGVGSFRLANMTEIRNSKQLRELMGL